MFYRVTDPHAHLEGQARADAIIAEVVAARNIDTERLNGKPLRINVLSDNVEVNEFDIPARVIRTYALGYTLNFVIRDLSDGKQDIAVVDHHHWDIVSVFRNAKGEALLRTNGGREIHHFDFSDDDTLIATAAAYALSVLGY